MSFMKFFQKHSGFSDGISEALETPHAVLLDVRSAQEFTGGHIQGSVNVPLDCLASATGKMRDIAKTSPLFVYCYSGARSEQACAILSRMGYTAKNIGGIAGYDGALVKGN